MAHASHLTPEDVLLKALSKRPAGTECVLVFDPDHLMDWGQSTLSDSTGRVWHRLLYAGDDIAFRFGLRRATARGGPRLIVATRTADQVDRKIILTYMADVLAAVEGDPIDLSLVAYFKTLFSKVSPPVEDLRTHKETFLASVPGLVKAYGQFKSKWGEPDSWTRGQLLAILLMAKYPGLRLEELWCDQSNPDEFLLHAVRLKLWPDFDTTDADIVRRVIRESSRLQDLSFADPWLRMDPPELAGYFVLREFVSRQGLAHASTLLAGKVAFTVDPQILEQKAAVVLNLVRSEPETWQQVNRLAEKQLSGRQIARVMDLLDRKPETLGAVVRDPAASPLVLREAIAGALREVFTHPKLPDLSWASELQPPVFKRLSLTDSAVARGAACLSECLANIEQIERQLGHSAPAVTTPEALLTWYVEQGVHLLELKLSEAFARLEAAGDEELLRLGESYLLAHPNCLKKRLRKYLDGIDAQLAAFVQADSRKFAYGPRSTMRLLAETVRKHQRQFGRVWILLFDGMRIDTWDAVVWPILGEHFQIVAGETRPWFAVLPSKTDIARRSLFAGALADGWKNYYGKPNRDERILAARALGVPNNQVDSQVRFIAEADTENARRKMGFTDADARDVNILIYPISDDLAHYQSDSLSSLNEKIRQQMMTQQGVRGILDDLRCRIGPEDLILVTSDHGFIELSPDRRVDFKKAEAYGAGCALEDVVAYRYLKDFKPPKGKDIGPNAPVDWEDPGGGGKKKTSFTLPVGSIWYHREGGKPASYAHGGISMAEMVVPGVLLKRITQKEARVELLDVPEQVSAEEDVLVTVALRLHNTGNVDAEFELMGSTNLEESVLDRRGRLPAGKSLQVELQFTPRYVLDGNRQMVPGKTTRTVTLRLRHTDVQGRMRDASDGRVVIRVAVKPKATKMLSDEMFKGLPV